MAGYDETVISGAAFQLMGLAEGSGPKGKECARENVLDSVIKIPPGGTLLEAMIDQVQKLMRDKPKYFAAGAWEFRLLVDKIQTEKMDKAPVYKIQTQKMDKAPVETGKAAAVMASIQMEKMDKAPVDGEKETGKEAVVIDKNQAERCAESEPPAGKYRLNADSDYVRTILAMPTEMPPCEIPYSRGDNVGDLLGVSEEWLEEQRQLYREVAARSERICNDFALFQEKVREESDRLGYFEVDDEYLDGVEEMQEYSQELGKHRVRSGFEFYDPEELCSVN